MLPDFDVAVFEQLTRDLGSSSDAGDFLRSFESLLPQRINRIETALKGQDREETITALLSLQASAAMVGASQLRSSATRALADPNVEMTAPGPLTRKLQGQAERFTHAVAQSTTLLGPTQALRNHPPGKLG